MTALRPEELPPEFVAAVAQHVPDREPAGHEAVARRLDGADWLAELPGRVEAALGRWELRRETSEPLRWGFTALVLPVLLPGGGPAALKLGWPHPEADHEHRALGVWHGRGAVRLPRRTVTSTVTASGPGLASASTPSSVVAATGATATGPSGAAAGCTATSPAATDANPASTGSSARIRRLICVSSQPSPNATAAVAPGPTLTGSAPAGT